VHWSPLRHQREWGEMQQRRRGDNDIIWNSPWLWNMSCLLWLNP
jgi:hypothetical protein